MTNCRKKQWNSIRHRGPTRKSLKKKDSTAMEVIGKHGENIGDGNGRRLIEHCIENDLIIANTFYTHKDINKITKEVQSRSEKSIIEYVYNSRKEQKKNDKRH
jgi:hypothetical protein